MVTNLHPIFQAALAPWWPAYREPEVKVVVKRRPKKVIMHINGNIYDNRKENLRKVDPKENLRGTN